MASQDPSAESFEKRAVISPEDTPAATPRPSQGCKTAAGKPTLDELADDAATRLADAAEKDS